MNVPLSQHIAPGPSVTERIFEVDLDRRPGDKAGYPSKFQIDSNNAILPTKK